MRGPLVPDARGVLRVDRLR